ncbi:unnamed protein product [Ectocarpus sp. 4 AP-2014]
MRTAVNLGHVFVLKMPVCVPWFSRDLRMRRGQHHNLWITWFYVKCMDPTDNARPEQRGRWIESCSLCCKRERWRRKQNLEQQQCSYILLLLAVEARRTRTLAYLRV